MIRRLYLNHFRCLENFELRIAEQSSVLLIGRNGAGKTTVGLALEILQKIARGTNRVDNLVKPKDLSWGRTEAPVRFEIEVELDGKVYEYVVAFEFPKGFKELRVLEEKLAVDQQPVYTREVAQVHLARTGGEQEREAKFLIDWHMVALPIIQEQSAMDPLFIFKQWLARMLILRPMPSSITGDSNQETLQPSREKEQHVQTRDDNRPQQRNMEHEIQRHGAAEHFGQVAGADGHLAQQPVGPAGPARIPVAAALAPGLCP